MPRGMRHHSTSTMSKLGPCNQRLAVWYMIGAKYGLSRPAVHGIIQWLLGQQLCARADVCAGHKVAQNVSNSIPFASLCEDLI
eukprot:1161590-Pelagomonas_calceolata.AAC.12